MNNILGTFIIAFVAGGYYVKDEDIKYVDEKCNKEYIIETYNGHFYECKPIDRQVNKQVIKEWINEFYSKASKRPLYQ